jgi:hypothetical protein
MCSGSFVALFFLSLLLNKLFQCNLVSSSGKFYVNMSLCVVLHQATLFSKYIDFGRNSMFVVFFLRLDKRKENSASAFDAIFALCMCVLASIP